MPYKDRGLWRGVVRIDGRRVSRAFPTKAEAKSWEAQEKGRPTSERKGLFDLAGRYLAFCEQHQSKGTHGRKTRTMRAFLPFIGDRPIESVLPGLIQDYFQDQLRARTQAAVNDDRDVLIAFWHWSMKMFDVRSNPVKKIPKIPTQPRKLYAPSEDDIDAILRAADLDEREWLLAYLLTGAREQELNRMSWDDLDFQGRRVRLWSRKNRDHVLLPAWIPMAESLAAMLSARRERVDSDLVFPSPRGGGLAVDRRRRLFSLCDKAGVPRFRFHGLRRYVGSWLAKSGEPIRVIQMILRHTTLAHTERYVKGLGLDLTPAMNRLGASLENTTGNTTRLRIVK